MFFCFLLSSGSITVLSECRCKPLAGSLRYRCSADNYTIPITPGLVAREILRVMCFPKNVNMVFNYGSQVKWITHAFLYSLSFTASGIITTPAHEYTNLWVEQ